MSFTQVTVTGTYSLPAGALWGSVIFEPSAAMANGGVIVAAAPVQVILDASGHFSVGLWANDDPATVPTGTNYTVTEQVGNAVREYSVVVPHASGSVDISTLAHL